MLTFNRPISEVRSFGLRVSPRYLSPLNEPLVERLRKLPTTRLRDACSVPLHRGVQPPKAAEEDDDEPALAIGVTELKDGYIDYAQARRIAHSFYIENSHGAGIRSGDLLIASTGATIGKVDVFDSEEAAVANNHTTIVRVDTRRFNPVFLLAFLRTRLFQFQIDRDWSGSAQPEIYPDELAVMRISALPKHKQDEAAARISAHESDIAAARTKVKPPASIIDEILCGTFRYPLSEHRERQRARQFKRSFLSFGDSYSLRGSVKFHHPDYELTDAYFASTPHQHVKAYLTVPIRLGASLTQEVMDDEGEAYYVHPSATRHEERIDTRDCHRITQAYYDANKRRAGLRVGDVLINRSGEGTIGKVALFDLNEPCLFSDFTMRLRFAGPMNPRFAWFYFRSVMFQSQVEREKRGMGNMMNIFPSQVETLLVPACRRTRQDALANQITSALDDRRRELQTIESRRQEIAALIESALSTPTKRRIAGGIRVHATSHPNH
jgi:type I restriction enzyme S subunit